MKKRTAFIGAILSLIPFGQPLLIKTGLVLSSTVQIIVFPLKVNAKSIDFYLKKLQEIYRQEGKENLTIYYANELLTIDPFNVDAYWFRAYAKVEKGLYTDGIQDYKKSIELGDNDSMTWTNIGFANSKLGDYYGAISNYNKSIEMDPKNITAFLNRGWAKKTLGDVRGSCDDWREAIRLGDNSIKQRVMKEC